MKYRIDTRLVVITTLILSALASAGSQAQSGASDASRPAPRHSNGKIMLGAPPGEKGMWGGTGSRPQLFELDEVPENSIIAYLTPEQLAADPDRFPKIKYSEIPYRPWAKALFEARAQTRFEPYTRCKPSGGPREVATAYGTEIVEFAGMDKIYIFPTGGPRHFRVIYMDGRPHPENLEPTYHGHSIGHWEGDTLVVDTMGFNEKMWIDAEGSPHTEELHLVERFTRLDFNTLKYEVTIDDPGAYTKPWQSGFYMNWSEGESFEFVCQDQNYAAETMVGVVYDSVDRSRAIFP